MRFLAILFLVACCGCTKQAPTTAPAAKTLPVTETLPVHTQAANKLEKIKFTNYEAFIRDPDVQKTLKGGDK